MLNAEVAANLRAVKEGLPNGVRLVAVSKPNILKQHTPQGKDSSVRAMSRNSRRNMIYCLRISNGIS